MLGFLAAEIVLAYAAIRTLIKRSTAGFVRAGNEAALEREAQKRR